MVILLIISPFSPAQTPNTLRWRAILKEFQKKGYKLHVLTTIFTHVPLEQTYSGVHIHRVGHHSLLDLYHNIRKSSKRRNVTGDSKTSVSSLFKILNATIGRIWRNVYWPDGTMLFLRPGIKKVQALIDKHDISHVISVGIPFTCHLIARYAKSNNPDIKWLMDIQDVFSFSKEFRVNNNFLYNTRNINAEADCFKWADAVALTNENALIEYKCLFESSANKMKVIPPLLEIPKRDKNFTQSSHENRRIRMYYFGSFYESVRSPEQFFQFLSQLANEGHISSKSFEFIFYGDHAPFVMQLYSRFSELHSIVKLGPFLKRDQMWEKMNEADFLLNFGNTTDYHLPSKLVEFIYFQKPVLNIAQTADDVSYEFLRGKTKVLNLNLKDESVETLVTKWNNFIDEKQVSMPVSMELLQPYLPESIAEKYLKLLAGGRQDI